MITINIKKITKDEMMEVEFACYNIIAKDSIIIPE